MQVTDAPTRKTRRLGAAALTLVMMAAIALVAVSTPAYAQNDGGEGNGDGIAERVGDLPLTPPGSGWLAEKVATDDGGSGSEGGGSRGSTDGGSGQGGGGPGGEPGPGGEAGQGTDDTPGEYGAWTEPINIAQGLVFICAGIGLSAGIITVGTAGGSRERHEKGIAMIGNTLAGFFLGTLAVQIYNVLGDVVVGF